MSSILEVKGLSKIFKGGLFEKDRQVLHGVSFALPEGSTGGFIGGNGHGKTTTLKCILGFIRPTAGEVHFYGKPISAQARGQIGYLPERPYLYEFLTAREFLKFHWSLAGGKTSEFEEASNRVLKIVELEGAADRRLRSFSKGMLQRAGLAQALIHRPKLLLLDEPMSGLDPDGRILVKEILKQQHQAGVTIFFSSHLLQDMDELCDHLTVIDKGRIMFDGAPETFRSTHPGLEEAFRAFRLREGRA